MATITVTLTGVCAGGDHLTFELSGDRTGTVQGLRAELSDPISAEEAQAFVKVLAKMAKAGRTNAQARALLEAGVTVTV